MKSNCDASRLVVHSTAALESNSSGVFVEMIMRARLSLVGLLVLLCSVDCFGVQAAPKGVKVEKDIRYVPDGDAAQALDLYLPEVPGDKPQPLIVWIHGGGWQGGSKAGCPAVGFVSDGFVVASVEYRF